MTSHQAVGRYCKADGSDEAVLPGRALGRYQLGAELKRLRRSLSLRLEEVAARLGVAPSTVSRIETGKAPTRTSYLAIMLDLYRVDDPQQRELLQDLAREGQRASWWAGYEDLLPAGYGDYLDLEAAASRVCSYSAQILPELLQTEDYAAAVYRATRPDLSTDQIRALVTLQLQRQQLVLDRGSRELALVIDESVLLRRVGSARVMADQLDQLRAVAAKPKVTLRVTALGAGQLVLSPPFRLLNFADLPDSDVGCRVSHNGQVILSRDETQVDAMRQTFTTLVSLALPYKHRANSLAQAPRSRPAHAGSVRLTRA